MSRGDIGQRMGRDQEVEEKFGLWRIPKNVLPFIHFRGPALRDSGVRAGAGRAGLCSYLVVMARLSSLVPIRKHHRVSTIFLATGIPDHENTSSDIWIEKCFHLSVINSKEDGKGRPSGEGMSATCAGQTDRDHASNSAA